MLVLLEILQTEVYRVLNYETTCSKKMSGKESNLSTIVFSTMVFWNWDDIHFTLTRRIMQPSPHSETNLLFKNIIDNTKPVDCNTRGLLGSRLGEGPQCVPNSTASANKRGTKSRRSRLLYTLGVGNIMQQLLQLKLSGKDNPSETTVSLFV